MILVVLAALAYAPALRLPFIEDDYHEIPLARSYAAAGWAPLWQNPALRARATSMILNAALDRVFGFTPAPFYVVSIVVHVLCVLLVFAAGAWAHVVDESSAFWAACFFAIYEGHQEAVMWISARSESLLLLFGLLSLLCWVKFLQSGKALWYAASFSAFLLAAFSKESFIVFAVFLVCACFGFERRGRALGALTPFLVVGAAYLAWTWFSRLAQPDYSDGRFSFSAPWLLVWGRSFFRLIFPWAFAVTPAILSPVLRRANRTTIGIAIAWMVVAILPYSFLTYMPFLASRHSYIASAGLALLVGAGAARLAQSGQRRALAAACIVVLALNLEIIWVKKMSQFRERAEPSELLKTAAREADGPVYIECTPFSAAMDEDVLASVGHHAVFPRAVIPNDRCFAINYDTLRGKHVSINRQLRNRKHGLLY